MSDPFVEDADALIARLQKDNERLRALEAKVKELLALIGTSDATIDLNVPLAFRELKNKVNAGYAQTRFKLNDTLIANSKDYDLNSLSVK